MSSISSREMFRKLNEFMVLPTNVISLDIHLKHDQVATMVITRAIAREEADELAKVISTHKFIDVSNADDQPSGDQ